MKRRFLAAVLAGCLFLPVFASCGGDSSGIPADLTMIRDGSEYYTISNDDVFVTIDKEIGYIRTVKNRKNDTVYKNPESGSWPFAIEYGLDRAEVSVSKSSNNRIDRVTAKKEGDEEALYVTYDNLKQDGASAKETGISATVRYALSENSNYFKMSVYLDLANVKDTNGGVYALKMLDGGDLVGAGSGQRLTAPTWNGGMYWRNPTGNQYFLSGQTLGYPGKDNRSLEAGWLDLSGDEGGIGIGLINRQMMTTEFRIKASSTGMSLSNVQFDPQEIIGKSVPLVAGETFQSDEMLVVLHDGDWHDTADAYRAEYQKAFVLEDGSPDYLTPETMSKKALQGDYVMRGIAGQDGALVSTFDQMIQSTMQIVNDMGGDPSRMLFWLAGQNTQGYAFDVPFMTPTYEPSGGDAGLKAMDDYFHELGASVFHYEHPFAVDPNRPEIAEILSQVDPMQHTEHWNMCTHHSVCIDNDIMYNMWKDEILPPILALEPDGFQLDQAPLWQTVCNLSGHNHGLDAVSMLTSHAKAIEKLEKLIRSSIDEGYIVSEASSDILTRYIDIRQQCWHHDILWDGEWEFGAGQFTHPNYIYQPSSIYNEKDENGYLVQYNAMLQGALYGGIMSLSDGAEGSIRKEFIRFKTAIREAQAPGYPFGFRDKVGVSSDSEAIDYIAFTDGNKVTVTYLTKSKVDGVVINVNLEELGFAGKGTRQITVSQERNILGFEIIDPNA